MCTLMTFSSEVFNANKDRILGQITSDGASNNDGWNLIIAGDKEEDAIFFQCLTLDWIVGVLTATTKFKRFWLHARKSTTKVSGLSGCHGFRSYTGWFIQHNGILRSGRADKLPVDSMVISELLEYMSANHVAQWLLAKESYANVFMINPTEGQYQVVRCEQGSLHTDGLGNYSSNSIKEVCEQEVPKGYHSTHTFTVERPKPVYQSYGYSGRSYHDDAEGWDNNSKWNLVTQKWESEKPSAPVKVEPKKPYYAPLMVATKKPATPATYLSKYEEFDWVGLTEAECIILVPDLNDAELEDLFYSRAWDVTGVPKDVFNQSPKKQRATLGRLYAKNKTERRTKKILSQN